MMQKVIVSHGEPKMDKMVRGRDFSYFRHLWSLHGRGVVCGAVLTPLEIKKVMKKQRRSNEREGRK
jgi:hypothetical protein